MTSSAERRYRRLLRVLPRQLRAEAGEELVETFRREHARVMARRPVARARFWARMGLDLLVTSIAERFAPRRPRVTMLGFFRHDVRDALRALVRAPAFTLIVAATLALGTGVNTAIFSVLDALLFKGLPYADADRLVRVAEWPRTGGNYTVAPAAFLDWRVNARAFNGLEARLPRPFVWLDTGDPEELRGAAVTPGYFDLLGVSASRGRTFATADGEIAAPCRIVVSHRLWQRRLDGDASALGRTIKFSGEDCTLIGILPAESVFDRGALEVFRPLTFTAADSAQQGRVLTVLGRLAPGATLDSARADLVRVAERFNATRGPAGRGWTAAVTPLRDVLVQTDTRRLAWVLFGAVGVVLLVACVNVASLTLARTVSRRRELALRAALGASRWRLFRGLAVESLALAMAGSALGLGVGTLVLRAFTALVPPGVLPAEAVAALDARALIFTAALAIVTTMLFGTLPAWQGAGGATALASGGRAVSGSRTASRLHGAFLVAQMAMATILMTGATLLVVSFGRLTSVDPGFDAARVLTIRLDAPAARYRTDGEIAAMYERTLDAIRRIPAVSRAGVVTSLPLGGWRFGTTFVVEGVAADPDRPTSAHIQHIGGDYFAALGIPLATGRGFGPADTAAAPLVAIVNQTFAQRFAEGGAIGRRLTLGIDTDGRTSAPPREIVGVMRDVKTGGLGDAALATPEIYVPHEQAPMSTMYVVVRAETADPSGVLPDVRAAVRSVDAQLAFSGVMTMDERIGASVRLQRFRTALISAFAILAALVACMGVYAVRSQAVRSRTREIGIRFALGATKRQVLALVFGQTFRLVIAGLALGWIGARLLTPTVEAWLFSTRATEPAILAIAGAGLALAAMLATWAPARRAAAVDPLTTLRQE